MKKTLTLITLIVVILLGGASLEAKTTKKKSKARTSQTSSSNWHGSIPTGAYAFKLIKNHNMRSALESKGYRKGQGETDFALIKDGVCIYEDWLASGGISYWFVVYDPASATRLYNELKKAIGKNTKYSLYKKGNKIQIDEYIQIYW